MTQNVSCIMTLIGFNQNTNEMQNLSCTYFCSKHVVGCLNDQANNCLIHFYKRCVSITVFNSCSLFRTEDSPLLLMWYVNVNFHSVRTWMGERLAIRRTHLTLGVSNGGMIERHLQWCFLSQPQLVYGMTRRKEGINVICISRQSVNTDFILNLWS